MAKGISFHFGVPAPRGICCSYDQLTGPLTDPHSMACIARAVGFCACDPIVGDNVTKDLVRYALRWAACALTEDDVLLLTYSGHGCPAIDISSAPELGGYDETWCLADGKLAEYEIHEELAKFKLGVRVLIVSDSCHSGAVYVYNPDQSVPLLPSTPAQLAYWSEYRLQVIESRRQEMWIGDRDLTSLLLPRRAAQIEIKASVMLLAACRDIEQAEDGNPNGLFTSKLVDAWKALPDRSSYAQFITQIYTEVSSQNSKQHPGIAFVGKRDLAFLAQHPFTV